MLKNMKTPIIAAALSLSSILLSTASFAEDYNINLNKTQVLRLPTSAGSVVIGNPEIADVSVHSQDTLFLLGRGYGETNLIVLDTDGHIIIDALVHVGSAPSANNIRIHRMGSGRETYACAPHCLPAPIHGDASEFIGRFQSNAVSIKNSTAASARTVTTGGSGYAAMVGAPAPAMMPPQTPFMPALPVMPQLPH